MFQKIEAFLIRCSTGCTCCRNENELRGPWRELQVAKEQAEAYARGPLLSSQYAPRGCYWIIKINTEVLPDGRLILENKLIAPGFIGENDVYDEPLLHGAQVYCLEGERVELVNSAA